MIIGIDIQSTFGQKTGFGIYTQNLIEELRKIAPGNQYLALFSEKKRDLNTPERWFWDQIQLPLLARRKKLTLLHKPCFSVPVFYPGKIIVTVNDLIPILFPQNFSLSARIYWAKWLPLSLKRADFLIAISEHTKKDIVKLLKIPEDKIRVIYLGASAHFKPSKDRQKVKKIIGEDNLNKGFILTTGTLEPRKNLTTLVSAFGLAKKRDKIKEKLIVVGKKGWKFETLFQLIKSEGLEKEIIFTDYIPDSDLPALYSAATLFAFPSLYEGFGLPVLEAMRCGTPVLSSNTSSMPEIIGQAGILINPFDIKNWAFWMTKILKDKNLRREFSQSGINQSRKFSWEKTARETLKVYQEAAGC